MGLRPSSPWVRLWLAAIAACTPGVWSEPAAEHIGYVVEWEAHESASEYRFEVRGRSKRIVLARSTKELSARFPLPRNDSYEVRVGVLPPEGGEVVWSPWEPLPPPPKLGLVGRTVEVLMTGGTLLKTEILSLKKDELTVRTNVGPITLKTRDLVRVTLTDGKKTRSLNAAQVRRAGDEEVVESGVLILTSGLRIKGTHARGRIDSIRSGVTGRVPVPDDALVVGAAQAKSPRKSVTFLVSKGKRLEVVMASGQVTTGTVVFISKTVLVLHTEVGLVHLYMAEIKDMRQL